MGNDQPKQQQATVVQLPAIVVQPPIKSISTPFLATAGAGKEPPSYDHGAAPAAKGAGPAILEHPYMPEQ